jgi:hypothetical protein
MNQNNQNTNPQLEKLFSKAKELQLSPAEKSAGWRYIQSHIHFETGPEIQPGANPDLTHSPRYDWMSFFSNRRMIAALVVMAVILGGSGIVSAASRSLPGDFLYPVKTEFNEKIRVAMARTPENRAQTETFLAEQRLRESEALAERGNLNVQTQKQIAENFESHTNNAINTVNQIRNSGNAYSAAILSDDLETVLTIHRDVISSLTIPPVGSSSSNVSSSSPNSNPDSNSPLNAALTNALISAVQARTEAEYKLTEANNEGKAKIVAEEIGQASKSALQAAQVAASSSAGHEHLNKALDYASQANSKFEQGQYGDAILLFSKAHRHADQAVLSTQINQEIKTVEPSGKSADSSNRKNTAEDGKGSSK